MISASYVIHFGREGVVDVFRLLVVYDCKICRSLFFGWVFRCSSLLWLIFVFLMPEVLRAGASCLIQNSQGTFAISIGATSPGERQDRG